MLRKIVLAGVSALLILPILSSVLNAVIIIPPYGETAWLTFSHTFDEDWEGWESYLLIHNIMLASHLYVLIGHKEKAPEPLVFRDFF